MTGNVRMLPRLLVSILALLSPAWALAAPSHVRIVQQEIGVRVRFPTKGSGGFCGPASLS